jgi:hypothetical protein
MGEVSMAKSNLNRTPLELLEHQTQLLENACGLQREILQQQNRVELVITKGIESILLEQGKQNRLLRNISAAAVLFTVLTLIGLAITFCSGAGLFL